MVDKLVCMGEAKFEYGLSVQDRFQNLLELTGDCSFSVYLQMCSIKLFDHSDLFNLNAAEMEQLIEASGPLVYEIAHQLRFPR